MLDAMVQLGQPDLIARMGLRRHMDNEIWKSDGFCHHFELE
jgi:hypothetical protein